MDDDSDGDGVINLSDISNLSVNSHQSQEISIYPNPVSDGYLHITAKQIISNITVYDISGKQMLNLDFPKEVFNLSLLPNGIYVFKFSSEDILQFRKIVINYILIPGGSSSR